MRHERRAWRVIGAPDPDVIIVGAGLAGLFAALSAAQEGASVVLVSGRPLADTASYWAQGGFAAAIADDDSPERHLEDTLSAGRRLVRREAAELLCREAPDCLRELNALGMRFDLDGDGNLGLGLEGGHSARRVARAGGSATGSHLTRHLSACVAETPGIAVVADTRVTDLLLHDGACVGVVCDDGRRLTARAVVLTTGGSAGLWSRTTNPAGSCGVGLQLARAAGAELADLELLQFHPTAVAGVASIDGFLVTEAIRGEGATLHDEHGERFVDELQPRDAVARGIYRQLTASGRANVWLDMRHIDPQRFPNVVAALRGAGIEPTEQRIPVAPAAHYSMGGIVTDLDGRSTVRGLFAAGECACTGLHGANRLASNSLTECCVFGRRAARAALDESLPAVTPTECQSTGALHELPTTATRAAVWRYAGVERDAVGLTTLLTDAHPLARLVAACALAREESRGGHLRADFPATDAALDHHHTRVAAGSETAEVVAAHALWADERVAVVNSHALSTGERVEVGL